MDNFWLYVVLVLIASIYLVPQVVRYLKNRPRTVTERAKDTQYTRAAGSAAQKRFDTTLKMEILQKPKDVRKSTSSKRQKNASQPATSRTKSKLKPLRLPQAHDKDATNRFICPPAQSTTPPYEFSTPEAEAVFHDGATAFCHLAHLPQVPKVAEMMKKLAKEFLPIIRQRGYNIRTISEMCCCADAADYELGGTKRKMHTGDKMEDGSGQDECLGYNRTVSSARGGRKEHTIHVRFRQQPDHNRLLSYSEVVHTLCHEIAHCGQQNHSPAFWKLNDEIVQESWDRKDGRSTKQYYPQQPAAFDIYGSSTYSSY
jgi:hypothetical protein